MEMTRMTIDIDENIKNDMEETCQALGLNIETVFTILAPGKSCPEKISDEKKIPFGQDGLVEIPNKGNRPRKTIEELFEGYDGDYKSEEVDWGKPVGNEVW